ncbi:unnamed protein product, partial [Effrenium voratum]
MPWKSKMPRVESVTLCAPRLSPWSDETDLQHCRSSRLRPFSGNMDQHLRSISWFNFDPHPGEGSAKLRVWCWAHSRGRVRCLQQVFLFDGLRTGVVEVLRPVLTSTAVTKVMHDSREDSSAFLSQFDIELAGVFDSQVAHTMMLENQATKPFQISLNELLKSVLKLENEKETSLGQRMKKDPNIWFYRPMKEDLLTYAAQDVMYLPLLHRRLCDQLGDRTGNRVMSRSQEYVKYARMNLHLSSPKAAQRRHLRLQAMLATHTDAALYFKLNLGAHRQGVVSREEALKNFKDMHYGQIADCWVSAWNTGGNILFLERLE